LIAERLLEEGEQGRHCRWRLPRRRLGAFGERDRLDIGSALRHGFERLAFIARRG